MCWLWPKLAFGKSMEEQPRHMCQMWQTMGALMAQRMVMLSLARDAWPGGREAKDQITTWDMVATA